MQCASVGYARRTPITGKIGFATDMNSDLESYASAVILIADVGAAMEKPIALRDNVSKAILALKRMCSAVKNGSTFAGECVGPSHFRCARCSSSADPIVLPCP